MEIIVSALAVIVALSCFVALIYNDYFRKDRNAAKARRTPEQPGEPDHRG